MDILWSLQAGGSKVKSTYYRHKKLRVSEEEVELGAVNSLDDSDDYEEHEEQYNADADSNSSKAVLIESEVEPPTDDIDWHVEVQLYWSIERGGATRYTNEFLANKF